MGSLNIVPENGTKGKGSICAFPESIFRCHGSTGMWAKISSLLP